MSDDERNPELRMKREVEYHQHIEVVVYCMNIYDSTERSKASFAAHNLTYIISLII